MPLYANDFFYSNDWLNCLYYEQNGAGYKSTAEDQKFFISAQGKSNPKSEYEESLKLVLKNDLTFKERFPYRYKLIAKQNNIAYNPVVKIDKNVTNVIIVYPNRYMGNPASMFGHLFLVLETNRGLLDSNILHFTAETDNDRSVSYMIKGLTGQYKGWFLEEAYYKKIKYYNYFEDRDIIYYDLKLSEDQIEDLQLHYIELKNTYFNYYFVDKNCAFYIGRLLNVVIKPDIITNLPYMMPSHVINDLFDYKLLKNERTRISNTKTFNTMFNNLNRKQKGEVVDLLNNKTDDIVDDADVLKTYITCSEYMINNNSELADIIRCNRIQAYKKLSSMNKSVARVTVVKKEKADRIQSGSIKLSRTFNDNYEFQYNPIYFSEYDQLEKLEVVRVKCFGAKVKISENRSPLYAIDLLDLVNISQYNEVLNSFSWKIKTELAYSDSLLGNQEFYVGIDLPPIFGHYVLENSTT